MLPTIEYTAVNSPDGSGYQDSDEGSQFSEEKIAFIEKDGRYKKSSFWGTNRLIIFHLPLIVLYTGVFLSLGLWWTTPCKFGPHGPDLFYSPARSVVEYNAVQFNNTLRGINSFRGPMRPEVDDAWRELLALQNLQVSEEDLKKANRSSVMMYDGEGYLAGLDVFHELHCLNYLREYIHQDYYILVEEPEVITYHIDHCIDTLRQTLMCHADISLVTYAWDPKVDQPWPNFNNVHECRNWDKIMDFAMANQPNRKNPGGPFLQNPYTGRFWPDFAAGESGSPILDSKPKSKITE